MPLRQPATKPGTSQDVHGNYGPVGKRFIPLFPRISSSPLILNRTMRAWPSVHSFRIAAAKKSLWVVKSSSWQ